MKTIQVTKNEISRRYQKLPIEQIELNHLKSYVDIENADIVIIQIGNKSKTLKDRYNAYHTISI